MRWFGGFLGLQLRHVPMGYRPVWSFGSSVCWTVGEWPGHEVHASRSDDHAVAAIGPTGMRRTDLDHLVTAGVPDDVAWRWPGSYTVIQLDRHTTTIWTDLGSAWPIYLHATDHGVYWASSSRALAALTGKKIDHDRLAVSLLAPGIPVLLAGRSAFAGVLPVPPGHRLVLPAAGQPEIRSAWTPRPQLGDHTERLRIELAAAVQVRVDEAVAPTVDLSGGYDSSTLALLAAERLQPARRITAVTVHPQGVADGGDLTYARLVAQHPGIEHRLMPIDADLIPYSNLATLPPTDEPAPSTIAYARFSSQLHWMRESFQSDSHLTGDGGDGLLCAPPLMLADLLRARHYRRAIIESLAWARLRRVSALDLLRSAYRTAVTPRSATLRALASSLQSGRPTRPAPVAWLPGPTSPPWATASLRDRAAAVALSVANLTDRHPVRDLTARVIAETMAEVGRTARADAQLAEAAGIALHNPFTDSRVINAWLSVPLNQRPGPAQFKPTLRAAMTDLFPAALAARTTKGSFTSDYYGGIRRNLPALRTLAQGQLAELGLIDPAAFRRTLALAAAGVQEAFVAVDPVVRAEAWLRTIEATPAVPWTAASRERVTA